MKKRMEKLIGSVVCILLLMAIVGTDVCAKEASLVYINWAEGIAYTHLAKAVLEDKLGYEVTLTAAVDLPGAFGLDAQGGTVR